MTILQKTTKMSFVAPENSAFLPDVVAFFSELNAQGFRYCHWKSNVRLEQSLAGKTDLDLLIDPVDAERFEKMLSTWNIKRLLAPVGKEYPGLKHYLGCDASTGRLFHLHVHYKLVLGEQFVKNYHLPIETVFLDSTYVQHDIKIPLPELELIVLVLRALLKYRDRDVVKDIFKIRSPGLPEHILDEFHWLLKQTSISSVAGVLARLELPLPSVSILKFLETITEDSRNGWKLFQLRGQIRQALASYQRQDRAWANAAYFQELWRRRSGWRMAPEQKMTLAGGGRMIALIGVDGAGKSTLCQDLSRWLSWKLETPLVYLGSKQPSRGSEWLYLLFRIARRSQTELALRLGQANLLARGLAGLRQVLLSIHYLSIGYDRFRRYEKAREKAEAGAVIIFDRFPFQAPLDGPEIHLVSGGNPRGATAFFSRREQELYQRFCFPDLLVLLKVSPQVSLQRKPDHPAETIAAKNCALAVLQDALLNGVGKNWSLVDANAQYNEVLLQVKRQVWAKL